MSMTSEKADTLLEQAVLDVLRRIACDEKGTDIVAAGHVYDVVATGAAVRVLIDPARVPNDAEESLVQAIVPLVEAVPGVERAVVKPRPRPVCQRQNLTGVRHVIGIHSGKGGVGKSTVAANLAVALTQMEQRVGLLDADVYGPSCPMMFGVGGRVETTSDGSRIEPRTAYGVKLMSLGFLMPAEQALIWRGSLIDEGLPQLFDDVDWGELDVLMIDFPPGTSDAHLAVAHHVALSGIITVTTPGQISVDDVRRGMEMFADIAVPCLGIIENMSGIQCPRCAHWQPLFGQGDGEALASETGITLLGSLPHHAEVGYGGDAGQPIVAANPEAEISRKFLQIANDLVNKLVDSDAGGSV